MEKFTFMKNLNIPILFLGLFVVSCTHSNRDKPLYAVPEVTYPVTHQTDQSDNYFGTVVKDPYRWLENDTATEVEAWVKEENRITENFLEKIPFRSKVKARLEELYNYARVTSPLKAGDYILYAKNNGLQNQPLVYRKKVKQDAEEVFIDPNQLSTDGTVAVNLLTVSKDNRYVTYTIAAAGSDWQEIRIKEVSTGKDLPDVLQNVKFSDASWYGNGFFYSRFPAPEKGRALQALNKFQRVYYHKLGTPQGKDLLIYEDTANPLRYNSVNISEDKKYLFLYVAEGTDGFECYYKPADLKKGGFKPLFTGFKNKSSVVEHFNGLFYVITDIDAPNYRLVAIDPVKPGKENWKVIIPETKNLLEGVYAVGGKLLAMYLQDVSSHLYQFDFSGKQEKEISFPAIGNAALLDARHDDSQFFYSFESYTYPVTIYSYDIKTSSRSTFFAPAVKFDPASFEVKQVFYNSKDGTRVPMFLVYRKGLEPNGKNPALLSGYGGFNISSTPYFSSSIMALLDFGVVFAEANIRGGSEYGESWHKEGMLLNKQNVFDDFIAAAEFLIAQKYTNPSKLGIYGGSNGGLLVGACITQRPDLFKVALPAVGVMDMLRYQKFTVGFGWVPEYGSSDDSINFINLYKFSPLHNIRGNVAYPATLITTGDHDDRVVPAHSFKFAATLQEKQTGKNPVLIRIETRAGHSSGKPVSKIIDETTDKWSFFLFNTQVKVE